MQGHEQLALSLELPSAGSWVFPVRVPPFPLGLYGIELIVS